MKKCLTLLFLLLAMAPRTMQSATSAGRAHQLLEQVIMTYTESHPNSSKALLNLLNYFVDTNTRRVPLELMDALHSADLLVAYHLATIACQAGYAKGREALDPQLNAQGKLFYKKAASMIDSASSDNHNKNRPSQPIRSV